MSARGIASFVAGIGTGYLNAEQKKKEEERQARRDKIEEQNAALALKRAEREEAKYKEEQALRDEIKAIPTTTNPTRREMTTDDVRSMTGGSADPAAPNFVSDEAAAHYKANVTGPEQIKSNAAAFAQMGVGDGLKGQDVAMRNGKMEVADPSKEQKVPVWKRMSQVAETKINSGIPEQEQLGYAALAQAETLKAKEMNRAIREGYAKSGAAGVLEAASKWDNEDFPFTDLRLENPKQEGGVYTLYGKKDGQETVVSKYDPKKFTAGMTIDDAILQHAEMLTKPEKLFEFRRQQILDARAAAKDEADIKGKQLNNEITGKKLANADTEIALSNQKARADINQSNEAAKTSRYNRETGGDKLPADVKTALWYEKATPQQREAFDAVKAKDPTVKITADALGGATITTGTEIYQLDRQGNIKPIVLPKPGAKTSAAAPAAPPKNRPPLTDKQFYK